MLGIFAIFLCLQHLWTATQEVSLKAEKPITSETTLYLFSYPTKERKNTPNLFYAFKLDLIDKKLSVYSALIREKFDSSSLTQEQIRALNFRHYSEKVIYAEKASNNSKRAISFPSRSSSPISKFPTHSSSFRPKSRLSRKSEYSSIKFPQEEESNSNFISANFSGHEKSEPPGDSDPSDPPSPDGSSDPSQSEDSEDSPESEESDGAEDKDAPSTPSDNGNGTTDEGSRGEETEPTIDVRPTPSGMEVAMVFHDEKISLEILKTEDNCYTTRFSQKNYETVFLVGEDAEHAFESIVSILKKKSIEEDQHETNDARSLALWALMLFLVVVCGCVLCYFMINRRKMLLEPGDFEEIELS